MLFSIIIWEIRGKFNDCASFARSKDGLAFRLLRDRLCFDFEDPRFEAVGLTRVKSVTSHFAVHLLLDQADSTNKTLSETGSIFRVIYFIKYKKYIIYY